MKKLQENEKKITEEIVEDTAEKLAEETAERLAEEITGEAPGKLAEELAEEAVVKPAQAERSEEKKPRGKKKKKRSIKNTFIEMTMLPALIIGIILTAISINSLFEHMTNEISNSLSIAAHSVYNAYSLIAPGDYKIKNGIAYKGVTKLEGDYSVVDGLKQSYDMEISLYIGSERVLTTITNDEGKRMVYRQAPAEAKKWVLERQREYFSKKININGKNYYGYYIPMLDKNKEVVGMAFAGKPAAEVENMVRTVVAKSILVSFAVIFITVLMSLVASQKMIESVDAIMDYLGHVSKSDFSQKMSPKAMQRDDEIGDMAKYASETGQILIKMITTDPLTGLYNRRACSQYLERQIERCNKVEENLVTVAIGDIDFFKKINDTYGHDCGDLVLKTLSEMFQNAIEKNEYGIVSRWGGEEFLFILEQSPDMATVTMVNLLRELRAYTFDYQGKQFSVTMSFGINGRILGSEYDEIIKQADDMLYKSKEGGRDQIRTVDGEVIRMYEA